MRKLIEKLSKWLIREVDDVSLSKWQRDIIYNFVIDYIEGVKKHNGK